MKVHGKWRVIGWLLLSLLIVAGIMEGVYQLMGNGTIARIVCTLALIAVAPFLIMPLVPPPAEGAVPPEEQDDSKSSANEE